MELVGLQASPRQGLVYQSHKVMPYSTACCTPLSNFEAQQNQEGIIDPLLSSLFPALTALTPDRNFHDHAVTLPSNSRFAPWKLFT